MQKLLFIAILTVTASSTIWAADAPKKPLTKWTCEDFIGLDESVQPNAVFFAEGLNKKEQPEDAMMDVEGTVTLTPLLVQECEKDHKASFLDKLKATWDRLKNKV